MAVYEKSNQKKGGNAQKGKIRIKDSPKNGIVFGGNPESILSQHPAWAISMCDRDSTCRWSFTKERLESCLWNEIIPKLVAFESMTWNEIYTQSKKQNHSIEVTELSKDACDRLSELHIEEESIRSLRLGGKHRIYGFLIGSVFNILWYDDNHGDNDTCVCPSRKKHT